MLSCRTTQRLVVLPKGTIERWSSCLARMNRQALTASCTRRYTGDMGTDGRARRRLRVLLVSELSLFGEGIEGVLRQEPGLEIVGRETDPEQAVRHIKESPPDVVILTDGDAATDLGWELLRLVREGFGMRVVEVDLTSNTLCSYCGEQQRIRKVRDLADAVRHTCHSANRKTQAPLSSATGEPAV
jgi:hypothetical protein